ncbi:MAG: trypsin-like peptidase domain-containing protein [Acidimicrobiia bacterium]|nr:trypsin-like peptidase domain-containing protein [Acidimicrobiia bacterium]
MWSILRNHPGYHALWLAALLLVGGCGPIQLVDTRAGSDPTVDPSLRAVRLDTSGCGFASGRIGSGVAVGDELILTVAHLVARADDIEITLTSGDVVNAHVTAIDLEKDLALLLVPSTGLDDVSLASARIGTAGFIEGGAASGTVPFTVRAAVSLSIEEILGSDRFTRLGYELDARTTTGDSGAGVFNTEDRLIGLVFATGKDGAATWATASTEIARFLTRATSDRSQIRAIACDPALSRLEGL